MPSPVVPGARFVDPKVLARIKDLELLARSVVDGFINGLHRAPYFGASIDFAEHRGYVAGDDIRRVDWRLYARTDKYFVKQYEADTNANFSVLLDVSKSMGFASGGLTKLEYGEIPRRVSGVPVAPPAGPRWHRHLRRGDRDARAARRRSTSTCCCTRSIAPRRCGPAGCCPCSAISSIISSGGASSRSFRISTKTQKTSSRR